MYSSDHSKMSYTAYRLISKSTSEATGKKESHMARSSRKSFPVEQMMEYLGYEKLIEEMLEKYVAGIYVYDDGRVEVE